MDKNIEKLLAQQEACALKRKALGSYRRQGDLGGAGGCDRFCVSENWTRLKDVTI